MNWNIPSAIDELLLGNPESPHFHSAKDWLLAFIKHEVDAGHPLMLGTIAEMLIDKICEVEDL